MKNQLRAWWKTGVALSMIWLSGEAFGVSFAGLPFWRIATGWVLLMLAFEYINQAAEDSTPDA